MASPGELLWASELSKANSLAPFLVVGTRKDVELRLIFTVGIEVRAEYLSASRTNRIRGWHLKSRRKVKPRVQIEFSFHTWDGGTSYREKQIWDVIVVRRHGTWHYFLRDRDVVVAYKPSRTKSEKGAARMKSISSSRKEKSWSRPRDFGLPSPIVRYASDIIHAQEVHNSQIPWNDIPYTVLAPIVYEPYRKSWSSVRTPGFGGLKPSQLPVNPYSSETVITHDGQGFVLNDGFLPFSSFEWYNHQWMNTSVLIASLLPPSLSHLESAYNKSLSKLLDSSQNSLSANLAQDIAQFGQLTRLVSSTANRFVGSIRALRRGDFKRATLFLWSGQKPSRHPGSFLSHTKTLASNWLELQYGWKPLLRDVQESMNLISRYLEKDPIVKVARGSGTVRTTEVKDVIIQGHKVGSLVIKTKTTCRIGLRYRISDHQKAFLSQTGFTNPINLGWEIIPFSFVVDWFLPIGPYLEKLSSFEGLEFVDGFQTQFTKREVSAEIHSMIEGQSVSGRFRALGSYSRREFKVDRIKLTAFPSAKIPSLKNPFSVTHALNALALLRVSFRK